MEGSATCLAGSCRPGTRSEQASLTAIAAASWEVPATPGRHLSGHKRKGASHRGLPPYVR
jgi:hypothetical protein